MNTRQILVLLCFFFVLGCSKEDVFGYSIPKSYLGVWIAPESELGNGDLVRNYQYVFSLNNIQEAIYGGGGTDYLIDFNNDFPVNDWEIQESFDQGQYEIIFTPKNANALTPWGTNGPVRRAFIYGTYNGQETIILNYAGANGALLFRK
ncbi:hypothetical protein [Flagellimonas meishanensis]|uniref:hypothetical protein n=1 Tax=Flagellimonas meishanensis TaxID=2873264 RepID=UPI001CA7004A|nr:hypothetical protein [[Muricauda] meishanensis]